MSINAYSSQKLENLELDHKEKWDYNSYNLRFRIYLALRYLLWLDREHKSTKSLSGKRFNW
jgi:hypothetical protein